MKEFKTRPFRKVVGWVLTVWSYVIATFVLFYLVLFSLIAGTFEWQVLLYFMLLALVWEFSRFLRSSYPFTFQGYKEWTNVRQ